MQNVNVSRTVVKHVAESLLAKAGTWSQVAKQLSGLTGKVAIDNKVSISVNEALSLLGVHIRGTKVTPRDLFTAWSERLKEGDPTHSVEAFINVSRTPQIVKNVAVSVEIGGKKTRLYQRVDGKFVAVKRQERINVVNADKRAKGEESVSAKAVLLGLYQSVFVEDTLASMERNHKAVDGLMTGYVNFGSKDEPKWTKVAKTESGLWAVVKSEKVAVKVTKRTKVA